MKLKTAAKKASLAAGVSLLALVLAFLLCVALMQTGWGRKTSARVIAGALSDGPHSQVLITGLQGRFPFHFHVGHLSWSDEEGPWLAAQGVTVHWSPWELLDGILRIKTLHASSLDIERTPEEKTEAIHPRPWPPAWITLLGKVRAEDLVIERFSLGERLLGEAAVLRLQGWLKSAPHEQEVSLTVNRLDTKGTNLEVRALIKDGRLTLDVKAHDRRDLLARLIGLEGSLSVSLQGEGELDHWEGDLTARAEAYGEIKSGVTLEAGRDFVVSAAGSVHLRPESLPPGLSHWIGGETPFHLEAVMAKETVTVRRFSLSRHDAGLTFSGSMDLPGGNTDGRFDLFCTDLEPLSRIMHGRAGGTFLVQGRFSGTLHQPVIGADVKLENAVLDNAQWSSLQGNIHLTFPDQRGAPHRVLGQGNVRDLRLGSFHDELGQWAFDLAGPLENRVAINEVEFLGKSLSLRATGGLNIAGPLSLELQMRGRWPLPPSLSSLEPFAGEAVAYEAQAVFEEGKRLRVSEARLTTANATLLAAGTFIIHEKALSASWDLEVPQLQDFALAPGYPLKGSIRISGTAEGPLERLSFKATGRGKDLLIRGLSMETAELNLLARGTPKQSQGNVSLSVAQRGEILKSRADFVLDHGKIFFPRFTLEGPETSLGGRLEVTIETGRLSGRMSGECRDLSALAPWFGKKVEGAVLIDTDFVLAGTGAELSLALEATDLSASYGRAERVRIRAQVTEPITAPRGRLNLDLTEGRFGEWSLHSSTIELDGNLEEALFQAFASGRGRDTFELQGSGAFSIHRRSMRWEALRGFYHKTPVRLASPLFLELGPQNYAVRGLALRFGDGLIKGAGHMEKGGLDFLLEVRGLALDAIPSPLVSSFSGSLSGELALKGTPAEPMARLAIGISGLKTDEESLKGLPPVFVEAQGDFRDRRLTADLSFKGLASEPFEARLALPLRFSLSPFAFSILSQAPLEGSLTGAMRLERIVALLGLHEQNMGGQGSLALKIDGTAEEPEISGHIRLNDGVYENLRTGTLLTRVRIDLSAGTHRLRVLEAEAWDGEGGTVSAEGWLDLAPNQGFPLNVVLRLDQAKLFRYDEAVAILSGTLSLEGSLRESQLSGTIDVVSSDFRIPDRLPESITEVDVIEINRKEGGSPPLKIQENKGAPWPLNLDVVIESPGRTFVRGRGLDSEWEGQIRASGKASQPSVTGRVSVVRGKADFLGRAFDVKRGTIAFGGSFPPSPFIDLIAEATAKDVTARLSIVGVLPSPDVKLSSQPPLPDDEILARLLFGRSAKNLTPIQALQLADALNTLSGGGMDLMGRTRRFLGVDQLAIKNTGEKLEDSALSAGKYLTEDVYVEVEKGISPETGKASVKWDVTPNVTVDTEVGVNAEAGLGVQWKWDY